MRSFFYVLSVSFFLNIPLTLHANNSSDDESDYFVSPYERSDPENNTSFIIYSSDPDEEQNITEIEDEDLNNIELIDNPFDIRKLTKSTDLQTPFAIDVKKITDFIKNVEKLNDALTDQSNHAKLEKSFNGRTNMENRYYFFLNFFGIYPYSIKFEINFLKDFLKTAGQNLPLRSKDFLDQNTKLELSNLDMIISKLENSKNTEITYNHFLNELDIINQTLTQSVIFFNALLKSEKSSPLYSDESDTISDIDEEILATAILESFIEENCEKRIHKSSNSTPKTSISSHLDTYYSDDDFCEQPDEYTKKFLDSDEEYQLLENDDYIYDDSDEDLESSKIKFIDADGKEF